MADWHWHTQWEGSVGQEGIAELFSRVVSVLSLGQPQYKPYPRKFARLTLLQLNWSQHWRLFCPTLFSPSAPSNAASMPKFFSKLRGDLFFQEFSFLPTDWFKVYLKCFSCTCTAEVSYSSFGTGSHVSSFAAVQSCVSVLVNVPDGVGPWDKIAQWSHVTFYETVSLSDSGIYCFSPMQWMHLGNWNIILILQFWNRSSNPKFFGLV